MSSNKLSLLSVLVGSALILNAKCPDVPVPNPTPTPIVTPTPTPELPPVQTNNCPVPLPDKSTLTINARCLYYNPQTQKCVTDSTPRVGDIGNDQGYCGVVTNNPDIHSCKANPEGSGYDGCDTQFLGGPCSYWYYSLTDGGVKNRCLPDGLGASPQFSCDHFDGWDESQGVYSGKCEHVNTGLHAPITGFGMVPHGKGYVYACNKDASICSLGIKVDY